MSIAPAAIDAAAVQTERPADSRQIDAGKASETNGKPENAPDRVAISEEGRAKAEEMQAEKAAAREGDGEGSESKSFNGNERSKGVGGAVDKAETVDELKDTESDISKKEDELQEAKTAFFGSPEEQARKIKELKQDIDDLEDLKKDLESELSR